MRSIAALTLAIALLTGAAPPPESELQRAADQFVATTQIPAVITLVEQTASAGSSPRAMLR
jgi:hypothetical protein